MVVHSAASRRGPFAVGAFLLVISSVLDLLAQAIVVSVSHSSAPGAAADHAIAASGAALLALAATFDTAQAYFWFAGYLLAGCVMLGDRRWPKWMAGLALVDGVLAYPRLPIVVTGWIGGLLDVAWMIGAAVVLIRDDAAA